MEYLRMIPFLDLHAAYLELKSDIDAAVARVLNSGWYVLGPEVEGFEVEWAEYCGADHAISLANGLDALILALRALGVGPGDEVIVPSNTYIATWLAVSAVGATPVPVEPNPVTFNIDATRIHPSITQATKVIIPVHLYGQPVDLDPILLLAHQHGIAVVEDAAQAHGATYKGKRIGAHGDVVCWSFYPGKNLGALGDGGAITTNRTDLADKVRLLRNYGSKVKYVTEVQGVNSRLDPIQAAVLRAKLPHLNAWNDRRRAIAMIYAEELQEADIILPKCQNWAGAVWHLFVVRTTNRKYFKQRLSEAGVDTLIHYPIPPHMQAAYKNLDLAAGSLPLARQLADEVLSLPIGPQMDRQTTDAVIKAIKQTSV